ncbi:hypothetical protein [Clostridium sp.]
MAIISNVLKKKVQGNVSIDSKPLLYLIVGVLFIITGVTRMSSVSLIRLFFKHQNYSLKDCMYMGVPIIIYVVLIGIGAYLTFMAIKINKQIEKIKVAVDVALYYFTISTVLHFLTVIIPALTYKNYGIKLWATMSLNLNSTR